MSLIQMPDSAMEVVPNLCPSLCVLVNTCGAYSDVWEPFFMALDEHLGANVPVYLNTDHAPIDLPQTKFKSRILTSEGEWGGRLLAALDQIEEDFILMLFDDYILEGACAERTLLNFLTILQNEPTIGVIYLNAVSLQYHPDIPGAGLRVIKPRSEYRINSAPGIWRRSVLASATHPQDTPWSWEVFGTYRSFSKSTVLLSPHSVKDNKFSYSWRTGGAIHRGKWVRPVIERAVARYQLNINLCDRGIEHQDNGKKLSLREKFNFLLLGYATSGLKFLWIFYFRFLDAKR